MLPFHINLFSRKQKTWASFSVSYQDTVIWDVFYYSLRVDSDTLVVVLLNRGSSGIFIPVYLYKDLIFRYIVRKSSSEYTGMKIKPFFTGINGMKICYTVGNPSSEVA